MAGCRRAGGGVDAVHAPPDDLGDELSHLELEVEFDSVCHWCELDVAGEGILVRLRSGGKGHGRM